MITTQAKEIVQNLFGTQPGMLPKEALAIVENALDKQTAAPPKYVCTVKSTDIIVEYFKTGNCPFCNHNVTTDHAYCANCGQKLDWSQSVAKQKGE